MTVERFRNQIQSGKELIGIRIALGDLRVTELVASGGFDFVYFDQQHGTVADKDLVTLVAAVQARGVAALVRVRQNARSLIGFALDAGADGVIVPEVNSAEEARAAVAACTYPPEGNRSYGMMTGGYSQQPSSGTTSLCFPMIESGRAVADAPAIAAVSGVSGIFIGRMDLAYDIGVPIEEMSTNQSHIQALRDIVTACRDANLPVGTSGELSELRSHGFNILILASDEALLRSASAAVVVKART